VVEFADVAVDATGGDFTVLAGYAAPIFKDFAVVETAVCGVGFEARGLEGGGPSGEESQDGVLGETGVGEEFAAGRRTAGFCIN